jgi:RNA polymerase sigma factor (sigma-70 family)
MDMEQIQKNLVKAHWNSLVWRLSWRGLDTERAKEFVQEAFLRLWQAMESGEHIESVKAWLIRVSENLYKDYLKSGANTKETLTEQGEFSENLLNVPVQTSNPEWAQNLPLEASNSEWIQRCVNENLQLFAKEHPERAEAIMLQLDDEPVARIAVVIGRSEQATRKFLSESKKKLIDFLMPCRELIS